MVHRNYGPRTPDLLEGFLVGTVWGMPVPSNILVFILPQTYMSVYYYDDSSLVEFFPGYESITT